MPDQPDPTPEQIYEALDLMVQAGWISEYARDEKNTAVQWTEDGKRAMLAVFMAITELGPENLSPELWWAVGTHALVRFRPGGPGLAELGLGE